MPIDGNTLFLILLFGLILYASYNSMSIKNKIHCTFLRPDLSRIEKWIKALQRRVEFDGGWYYVNPNRISLKVLDKGIFALFPTKASSLIYKWDSSQPLDPKTFQNTWETPEARKSLNKEEDIRAYSAGSVQAITRPKQTMLERLMPILMVVTVVIVGYMMYSMTKRMDMIGNALNVIQQMLMR